MPDFSSSLVSGVAAHGWRRGGTTSDPWYQFVVPVRDRAPSFTGRSTSFRTTGRAAATQNVMSLYNSSATVLVAVNRVFFDVYDTAARLITVHPAIVRVSRITAAPTNGTVLTQTAMDTTQSSDAGVVARGDASADGTNSASALTVTIPAGTVLTQEVLSRNVWISGTAPPAGTFTELADRVSFFDGTEVVLRQNQGIALHLTSPGGTSIPNTSFFVAGMDWEEYTRA